MWQRHQTDRWQLYAQSIDQLISQCSNESPVMLNISDGSVLALLAGFFDVEVYSLVFQHSINVNNFRCV
jgi:hypothetical protein